MKKVLIYGHGVSASIVREKIKAYSEEFCFYAYLTEKKTEDSLDFNSLNRVVNEDFVVIIPNPGKRTPELLEKLYSLNCKNIYFVPSGELRKTTNNREQFLVPVSAGKPWLTGFEFHVADHCNLNCTGCGHCANLFSESFPSLDTYRRDLLRIKELYAGVGLIRLMGGEPLLNPELPEFILLTRRIFPISEIHVVTNGLLLEKMPVSFYQTLKEAFVMLDISQYPPTRKRWDKIEKAVVSGSVEMHVTEVNDFYRRFTIKESSDKNEVFPECSTRTCHSLRDGKLAACIVPFSTEVLNKVYGLNVPVDGWINLYEEGITGEEINRRLSTPLNLCNHCRKEKEFYPWSAHSRADASLRDWIVGGPVNG